MYKIIRIDENGEKSIENCVPCLFNNRKEAAHTVYSDRLHQWDSKKHNELCKKHFGDESQYWSGRKPQLIESFLKDYLDDESVVLCKIEEHENQSSGYPLWRFDYNKKEVNIN